MWFSYYIMRESIWILHHHLPSSLQMCFLPHAHKLLCVANIYTTSLLLHVAKSVETSSCCPFRPETHSSDTCFPLQLFEFETLVYQGDCLHGFQDLSYKKCKSTLWNMNWFGSVSWEIWVQTVWLVPAFRLGSLFQKDIRAAERFALTLEASG